MSEANTVEAAIVAYALTQMLGEENVLSDVSARERYAVDGVVPKAVAFPQRVEQVSDVLALAHEHGLAVIPRGGGTLVGLGQPPRRADILLCLTALKRLVEHEPADLTATVEAGLTLGAFQRHLAPHNQWLPLDPPLADKATIGGLIAANASGPHRTGYGSWRDYLIGLKVVADDGSLFKSGGKVVKNVAGYDLHKLLTGALGTLGVIVEATFKLWPRPPATATLLARFESIGGIAAAAKQAQDARLRPVALEGLDAGAAKSLGLTGERWLLAVRFAGLPAAVERQMRDMSGCARDTGGVGAETLTGDAEAAFWQGQADMPARLLAGAGPDAVRVRASVLPTQIPDLADAMRHVARTHGLHVERWARVGVGLAYAIYHPATAGSMTTLQDAIAALRSQTLRLGGALVVEDAPPEAKAAGVVWGPPRGDFPAMRAIKQQYDPKGILNPGRFVGEL